ncbi:hypothetical protein C8R45DRAFT_401953 [Mycena sanguinolenta]|nr:hypothetical protein C8R45DRAFT_401953 [Mycena sanguinolenta]
MRDTFGSWRRFASLVCLLFMVAVTMAQWGRWRGDWPGDENRSRAVCAATTDILLPRTSLGPLGWRFVRRWTSRRAEVQAWADLDERAPSVCSYSAGDLQYQQPHSTSSYFPILPLSLYWRHVGVQRGVLRAVPLHPTRFLVPRIDALPPPFLARPPAVCTLTPCRQYPQLAVPRRSLRQSFLEPRIRSPLPHSRPATWMLSPNPLEPRLGFRCNRIPPPRLHTPAGVLEAKTTWTRWCKSSSSAMIKICSACCPRDERGWEAGGHSWDT